MRFPPPQSFHFTVEKKSSEGSWASLWAQTVKNPPAMQETCQFLGREDPLEEGWQLIPVLLSGESYGQRSLLGYGS